MKQQHRMKQQQKLVRAPKFIFNRTQIAIHLAFFAIYVFFGLRLLIGTAASNQQKTTQPSYMTPYLHLERDSHDLQWQTFRSNFPVLVVLMFGWHVIASKIQKTRNQKAWILGLAILLYSYRSDIILFAILMIFWYFFTIYCVKIKYFVPLCWTITIVLLFYNQSTQHFADLSRYIGSFIPFEAFNSHSRLLSCGQNLNMTLLKLLSFSIDFKRGEEKKQLEKHKDKCLQCHGDHYCLKGRNYLEPDSYGWLNYSNYILFAPIFLAGPPIGFKNYISFKQRPSIKRPDYQHFIFLFVTFQLFQHYLPVLPLNSDQTLIQAELITLFHLVFIWYKFLIFWRFHRLWAQLYGIEVVDNLSRCIFNNYGFQGFWRMWHRGFNQWLIRYIYIPLGGNHNLWSVIATVAFVAFWHDHRINIVIWALVIVLFILPEILIKRYVKTKHAYLFKYHWFKYLCAFASSVYIYFLILTNIVGFGYGYDQLPLLWERIVNEWIWLLWSLVIVTSCVILMFYKRHLEDNRKNY